MSCEICIKEIPTISDESGNFCESCYNKAFIESALNAGIPLSVIEGKTKLSDHFPREYIEEQIAKARGES